MSVAAARFHVVGRVQGVFFSASTRSEAQRLGLKGYARNLADGRVQVLAVGDAQALAELQRWLHAGPPAARVTEVHREDLVECELSAADPQDFRTD